jgi:hypothetical protein
MQLELVAAEDSSVGAVFAYGPGVFVHVPDGEALGIGQGIGYLSPNIHVTNRRGLDVLAALCLAGNVTVQPSAIAVT